ncbi:MAG: hypothetical protein ACK4UN_07860 [Limisphaerales bacterium]
MNALKITMAALALSSFLAHGEVLYTNSFDKAEIGKVPEELMVLDGQFAVQEEGGNKFLELPGAPTDTYTVMFGPTTNANVSVSARVYATSKGRRMPAFGVALSGVAGYKMQVAAAKKSIELFKGDKLVQTVDYDWKSGEWTSLQLAAVKKGDVVSVEGKISQGNGKDAVVTFEDSGSLTPGRASISGTPFAGTPIWFDDLAVVAARSNQ